MREEREKENRTPVKEGRRATLVTNVIKDIANESDIAKREGSNNTAIKRGFSDGRRLVRACGLRTLPASRMQCNARLGRHTHGEYTPLLFLYIRIPRSCARPLRLPITHERDIFFLPRRMCCGWVLTHARTHIASRNIIEWLPTKQVLTSGVCTLVRCLNFKRPSADMRRRLPKV